MKKIFNGLMACTLVCAAFVYTSCTKDLQDDIAGLGDRLTVVEGKLSTLQQEIENGAVIKSVDKTSNGVKVTLSNNETFELTNGANGKDGKDGANGTNGTNGTNGKDGQDGKDGKDAAVWTIGTDGYWYKDNVKTAYKAVGQDGKDGTNGTNGTNGINGTNGTNGKDGDTIYFAPENGVWVKYVNGTKDASYKGESVYVPGTITAVWNAQAGKLELYGVEGVEAGKPYVIAANSELNSLAFVPTCVNDKIHYPTTENPFKYIATYITESKYNADYTFKAQNMDASNSIELLYRVNPTSANLTGYAYQFINRAVTTRAAGDKDGLLVADFYNEKPYTIGQGTLTADVRYNISKKQATSSKYDLVALEASCGNAVTVSDYITVDHESASLIPVILKVNGKTALYNRTKAIVTGANEENDAFVKSFVALNAAANFTFAYNKTLDLKPLVALYDKTSKEKIASLDFNKVEYKFSCPKEYLADDNQKTDQQEFVTIENGVVTPKSMYGTSVIGRTPIVRVDAYVGDNAGVSHMVASAYIKVAIADSNVEIEDAADINLTIDNARNNSKFIYHTLKSDYSDLVAEKPWKEINTQLYAATETSSTTFWNYYGGTGKNYTVTVSTTDKNGNVVKWSETGTANTACVVTAPGIKVVVDLNEDITTTSNIKVTVNNQVETENTYKAVNGSAKYDVKIAIASNDKKLANKGDIFLTQTFYVEDQCKTFAHNELYYNGNAILVKGQIGATSNTWELSSYIREHFAKISGKDIFGYCTDPVINKLNIQNVAFSLPSNVSGVKISGTGTDTQIALSSALTTATKECTVNYTVTLVNGEVCEHSYKVIFINPFMDGSQGTLQIIDAPGATYAQSKPFVKVVDTNNQAILAINAAGTTLVHTQYATDTYKLPSPTVKFAFDTNATDYKTVTNNLASGSKLEIKSSTGEITWLNLGSALKDGSVYNIPVICTVTYANLSVVKCKVNVQLKAAR